ncbi:MAG: cobalt-precorrin-6A reductase [Jaaginema sp. PMC 1079.18]|nr:cobalt-precorrin-6A reductase [Jaaginema sp. PMC 1080.18]MEC4853883.1 cobalt-precorrin-6A reductase [Jaaginema sp. PMC 1079.18]MEC4864976.1 cobalt-precorrin-6A reductase [Jaaginema sp. PMC 1078.18]
MLTSEGVPMLECSARLPRIWLIGGTRESRSIAEAIASRHFCCLITVTTPEARKLYPVSPFLEVWVGRIAAASLGEFVQQQGIVGIVDASHPFATIISENAIAIARHLHLPYLRYERPSTENSKVIYLDSFATLLESDYLANQRVLLTVGVQVLPLFRDWQSRATLFARILPSLDSLTRAIAAGMPPERIIALRPPYSAAFERALWQQWGITLVVTKASGKAGGEAVKQQVAEELDIPLIAIARPKIDYPQQCDRLDVIISFCQRILGK